MYLDTRSEATHVPRQPRLFAKVRAWIVRLFRLNYRSMQCHPPSTHQQPSTPPSTKPPYILYSTSSSKHRTLVCRITTLMVSVKHPSESPASQASQVDLNPAFVMC
jgi:hypothetical protein